MTDTRLGYAADLPVLRRPAVVLTAATAAILAGAGMTYAGLAGSSGTPTARAEPPGVVVSVLPSEPPLRLDPAMPGVAPIGSPSLSPSPSAGAGSSPTVEASPTAEASPIAEPSAPNLPPEDDDPWHPRPSWPEPTPEETAPLTATLTHVAGDSDLGYVGYAGTVRIDNPGHWDRTGWRLTLTVLGGNLVEGAGVSVAQDGESVTFTPPGDEAVPAGGSVTFSFGVLGALPALPVGCTIDGNPCS